jgi:UrcA family protein
VTEPAGRERHIALNDATEETRMNITSTNLSRVIKTAILGTLALSCGAVSMAADYHDVPTAVVKFGDLNLSNPQGALRLYSRIVAAANEVCRPFAIDDRDLGSQARLKTCVHKATADAVSTVGRPELSAIYNAKNHQSPAIIVAATR